jgi:hypothetical protein
MSRLPLFTLLPGASRSVLLSSLSASESEDQKNETNFNSHHRLLCVFVDPTARLDSNKRDNKKGKAGAAIASHDCNQLVAAGGECRAAQSTQQSHRS